MARFASPRDRARSFQRALRDSGRTAARLSIPPKLTSRHVPCSQVIGNAILECSFRPAPATAGTSRDWLHARAGSS